VRHLGQQRPERQDERHLAPARELENRAAVGLPAQVWLDGHAQDDVARQRRSLADRELRGRPRDLTLGLRAGLEANVRSGEAEVVELLGIDLGELLGPEGRAQVAHGGCRRFGGVVPAAKRHDQDGPAEALGS